MKNFFHLKILIIGIALITSCENQELLTLSEPFNPHFGFFPEHQAEDLSMALTEHHPLFLYASSQNQFNADHFQAPQNQFTEHFQHKEQPSGIRPSNNNARPREARQQFYGSSSLNEQRNANNNNRHSKTDHPPLTYGFVPRIPKSTSDSQHPNSNTAYNTPSEQRNNNFRNNASNNRNQQQSFPSPGFRAENTQGQHFRRNKQFSENARAVFSHDQHESANLASTKIQNDHSKLSGANPSAQNFASNAFNPQFVTSGRQHELRNHNLNAENIQESVRQHTIYANNGAIEKNNKDHNRERNPVFQPNFVTRSQVDRNVRNRNQNTNLNLYNNARRIPDHNKPQLPSRKPLHNNGMRAEIPEVLPVLHLGNSNSNAAGNSPVYIRNTNAPESITSDDPEKKTYLVFKAPTQVTTEQPPPASDSIRDLGNFLSTIHTPEISYTTQLPDQQSVLPTQNIDNEAIILDLIQIPDEEAYAKDNGPVSEGSSNTDHRISVNKAQNNLEDTSDLKSNVDTTQTDINKHEFYHHDKQYTTATEAYHQHKAQSVLDRVFPEYKKASNVSFLPISYSSSISVAVDQGTNKKPQAVKSSKLTLKKALSQRKKPKLPENHDYIYSDPYGQQNVPGKPGTDYPTYGEIPFTNFDCRTFKAPGFYADLEAGCQVFHNCDMDMTKHSFMCPNGTIFHQELFICDWWYNVRCDDSPEYFSLNSGLFTIDQHHKDSLK